MNDKLLKDIAISESGLVFNPVTGESFSVNPSGVEIIQLLRKGKTITEIKKILSADYDVDINTAERDVLDFFNLLKHFRIIASDERN
jgi:hypothetical protein